MQFVMTSLRKEHREVLVQLAQRKRRIYKATGNEKRSNNNEKSDNGKFRLKSKYEHKGTSQS
jgi:hypothetical protein